MDEPQYAEGLSPRVRGNHLSVQHDAEWRRSIPACAGEPGVTWMNPSMQRVYPRVCGGTTYPFNTMLNGGGLSPRVRGNLYPLGQRGYHQRSIPACAGEPPFRGPPSATRTVYPRVCGGTYVDGGRRLTVDGLSPRVRGNLARLRLQGLGCRSIPACAGEPPPPGLRRTPGPVYPRVCGGTKPRRLGIGPLRGLSPRVRGNRAPPAARSPGARSIPACAGEPAGGSASRCPCAVYPRVCGGTAFVQSTQQ